MNYFKLVCVLAIAICGIVYANDSDNGEKDQGYWNQNPHRYGNWNRNQYNNQPGAYQENRGSNPQNLNQPQSRYQYQNNPQNRNAEFQNRQISAGDNPVPPTPTHSTEKELQQ